MFALRSQGSGVLFFSHQASFAALTGVTRRAAGKGGEGGSRGRKGLLVLGSCCGPVLWFVFFQHPELPQLHSDQSKTLAPG